MSTRLLILFLVYGTRRGAADRPTRLDVLALVACNHHGLVVRHKALKLRGGLCRRTAVASAAAAATGLLGPSRETQVTTVAHWAIGPRGAGAFVAGKDEEISGLVVLRVAEVCDFQEKLLRQLAACSALKQSPGLLNRKKTPADQFGNAYCEGEAYSVNPVQISFGTGILLKNANLDGNLKVIRPPPPPQPRPAPPRRRTTASPRLASPRQLMIRDEVPKAQREAAVSSAVRIMNTFNELANCQNAYGVAFDDAGMLAVAEVYADARRQLARFFDFLPAEAQSRFFNYAAGVREYEEEFSKEGGIERMKL